MFVNVIGEAKLMKDSMMTQPKMTDEMITKLGFSRENIGKNSDTKNMFNLHAP